MGKINIYQAAIFVKIERTDYRKDTEHLCHAFMYSRVSHFLPVSIRYLQCIHCLLHQMLEIFNRHQTEI